MALIKALLEKPPSLTTASKYTAMNGFIYLAGWLPTDYLAGRYPDAL